MYVYDVYLSIVSYISVSGKKSEAFPFIYLFLFIPFISVLVVKINLCLVFFSGF